MQMNKLVSFDIQNFLSTFDIFGLQETWDIDSNYLNAYFQGQISECVVHFNGYFTILRPKLRHKTELCIWNVLYLHFC